MVSEDEEFEATVTPSTSKTQPKRKCTPKTYNFEASDNDSEEESLPQNNCNVSNKSENMEDGFDADKFANKLRPDD